MAEVKPGFFHLKAPIVTGDWREAAGEKKLRELEHDRRACPGLPEELAILNVSAVLKYRLRRYSEAEASLQEILTGQDPRNLNALANLVHVLEKLHRKPEAKRVKAKLEALLQSGRNAEGAATGDDADASRAMRARCLAEQAYLYACDLHVGEKAAVVELQLEAGAMFGEALALAQDRVDASEQDAWRFFQAKCAHKVFDRRVFGESYAQAVKCMDEAVELFHMVARREAGRPEYRWQSWRHLADIYRRVSTKKELKSRYIPPELASLRANPEVGMVRAMEVSPDNPKLLARYGNFLYTYKREYGRAVRLLDRSVSLDDSDNNFYALHTRGEISVKHYKWMQTKWNEDKTKFQRPDRELLERAREDLERSMDQRWPVWDLINLASVHNLLAHDSKDASPDESQAHLRRELEYLTRAADCEDDSRAKVIPRSLGRCQFDLGDYREAVRHFQEALALESRTSMYTGIFHELFRAYLCLMRAEEDESLREEVVGQLRRAINKYGASALARRCVGSLRDEYRHELELLAEHCETLPETDNEALLFLLRCQTPASPLSPPDRPGGMLRKIWRGREESGAGDGGASLDSAAPDGPSPSAGALPPSPPSSVGGPGQAGRPPPPPSSSRAGSDGANDPAVGRGASGGPSSGEDSAAATMTLLSKDLSSLDLREEEGVKKEEEEEVVSSAASPSGLDYDFNVVYSDNDADWVLKTLLTELEARGLSGSARAQDALAGSFVVREDERLMRFSACLLLLVGPDFEKDCSFNMQHALRLGRERGALVVPLRRQGANMPRELRGILNDVLVPDPPRQLDWDKLARRIKAHCREVGAPFAIKATSSKPSSLSLSPSTRS